MKINYNKTIQDQDELLESVLIDITNTDMSVNISKLRTMILKYKVDLTVSTYGLYKGEWMIHEWNNPGMEYRKIAYSVADYTKDAWLSIACNGFSNPNLDQIALTIAIWLSSYERISMASISWVILDPHTQYHHDPYQI